MTTNRTEYSREYYKKNAEKSRAYQAAYRKKNRARISANNAKRYKRKVVEAVKAADKKPPQKSFQYNSVYLQMLGGNCHAHREILVNGEKIGSFHLTLCPGGRENVSGWQLHITDGRYSILPRTWLVPAHLCKPNGEMIDQSGKTLDPAFLQGEEYIHECVRNHFEGDYRSSEWYPSDYRWETPCGTLQEIAR